MRGRVVQGDRVRRVQPAPFDLSDVLGVVAALSDEDRRLLDEVHALIVTHGFPRTLIDDIARRGGVTRRTLNRRLGDKDGVVRTVVVRTDMASTVAQHYQMAPTTTDPLILTTRRNARPENTGKAGQTSGYRTPTIKQSRSADPYTTQPSPSVDRG